MPLSSTHWFSDKSEYFFYHSYLYSIFVYSFFDFQQFDYDLPSVVVFVFVIFEAC